MSLINEALKRADAEKRSGQDQADLPDLPPVLNGGGGRGFSPGGIAVLGVVVLVGAIVAWAVSRPGGPEKASARPVASNVSAAKVEAPPIPLVKVSPEAEQTFARTIEAIRYYQPPAAVEIPADVAAEADKPAGEIAAADPPEKPKPAAAEAPKPAGPPDLSKFKVSGIVHGPNGWTAIINGSFMTVGRTIDEAKVVRISQYEVVLEIAGQRHRIGM